MSNIITLQELLDADFSHAVNGDMCGADIVASVKSAQIIYRRNIVRTFHNPTATLLQLFSDLGYRHVSRETINESNIGEFLKRASKLPFSEGLQLLKEHHDGYFDHMDGWHSAQYSGIDVCIESFTGELLIQCQEQSAYFYNGVEYFSGYNNTHEGVRLIKACQATTSRLEDLFNPNILKQVASDMYILNGYILCKQTMDNDIPIIEIVGVEVE